MADINYPIANNDDFNQHKLDYVAHKDNYMQHLNRAYFLCPALIFYMKVR